MNQSYANHQTEGEKIIGGLMELVNFAQTKLFCGAMGDLSCGASAPKAHDAPNRAMRAKMMFFMG